MGISLVCFPNLQFEIEAEFARSKMDGGGKPKTTKDFPWCCTILARTFGVITALVMFLCGIVTLIPTGIFFGSFGSVGRCIGAGILMLIFSLCMLFIEAPFLGYFIPQLQFIVKYTSYVKSWVRTIIYFGFLIVPVMICASVSTVISQGLLLLLAVFYFVLTIGAKGDHTTEYIARYHNRSGEIDMILQEDMEDSEEEEIHISSGPAGKDQP